MHDSEDLSQLRLGQLHSLLFRRQRADEQLLVGFDKRRGPSVSDGRCRTVVLFELRLHFQCRLGGEPHHLFRPIRGNAGLFAHVQRIPSPACRRVGATPQHRRQGRYRDRLRQGRISCAPLSRRTKPRHRLRSELRSGSHVGAGREHSRRSRIFLGGYRSAALRLRLQQDDVGAYRRDRAVRSRGPPHRLGRARNHPVPPNSGRSPHSGRDGVLGHLL